MMFIKVLVCELLCKLWKCRGGRIEFRGIEYFLKKGCN